MAEKHSSKTSLISLIIPTYNESENIESILDQVETVFKQNKIKGEIIIVDDDSQDGTGKLVKKFKKENQFDNIRLIVRKDEKGLSSAVLKGFDEAKGEILCVMDADLSHPPKLLPKLIAPIRASEADMTIGSRYIEGGGVENWPTRRKLISQSATLLAKFVTNVKDPMSGFFALKRSVIKGVKMNPKGYKIALEIIARGNYKTIVEVPFWFRDRQYGESKLSNKIITEYLSHLTSILFAKNSTSGQFIKFCIVGAIGTFVNLAVLYSIVEWVLVGISWGYMLGATIAFFVAVTSNYILNKIWTFKFKTKETSAVVGSYVKFIIVSIIGLAINLIILYILVDFLHIWYIFSQIIAIGVAMVWNFIGSQAWAFRTASPTEN